MKTLLITILILFLSSPVFADQDEDTLRCNPVNGRWSYESSENTLKPNPATGQWTYEDPESTLKYNPMEDRWEYAE